MSGGSLTAPWFTAAQFESGVEDGSRAPPAPPKPNVPARPRAPPPPPPRPSGFVPAAPSIVGALGLNVHPAATAANAGARNRGPTPVFAWQPPILHRIRSSPRQRVAGKTPAGVELVDEDAFLHRRVVLHQLVHLLDRRVEDSDAGDGGVADGADDG